MSARSRAEPWFGPRPPGRPALDPARPDDPEIEWITVTPETDVGSMFGWVREERRRLLVELLGHVPSWSATITGVA